LYTLPGSPVCVAMQLAAQEYPDGQQPPPSPAAQLYHPVAHIPGSRAAVVVVVVVPELEAPPTTITVAPLEVGLAELGLGDESVTVVTPDPVATTIVTSLPDTIVALEGVIKQELVPQPYPI